MIRIKQINAEINIKIELKCIVNIYCLITFYTHAYRFHKHELTITWII